jgi:hypothetical protein
VGFLRRLLERLSETDEERLADTIHDWARSIPDTVRIVDAPPRAKVKVAAIVNRISVIPGPGGDSLEAVITDGTGEVTAVWTGRVSIPGLRLGSRMVAEGMLREDPSGRRIMVNPGFEFSAKQV